ncbi:MAG: hypothetical protein ACI9BD_000954 [Candidatus Marinamargulisbacteria bacterium]
MTIIAGTRFTQIDPPEWYNFSQMGINDSAYFIIEPEAYRRLAQQLVPKLRALDGNRVTFKNEIHRTSRFAICHYAIEKDKEGFKLTYDEAQSAIASNQKKTNSNPEMLNDPVVRDLLACFLEDINDETVVRAEVKLIQTDTFPFIFNPHRDSQFRRLRHIVYLATVILSVGGIEGGNMQLFHSENDKVGPFQLIEELPAECGVGYIVDERPQRIFHGMKSAYQKDETAHRAAFLVRFFNAPLGFGS